MSNLPHPTPLPLGFSEAAMLLRSPSPKNIIALISIHGTYESPLDSTLTPRLDLTFDDIDNPDPADLLATYHALQLKRHNEHNGLHLQPPTAQHAQAIIDFAKPLQHHTGILLIHCSGGISRSPAAALICLATWTPPGQEPLCLQTLLHLRPAAQPHQDLVRFADTLLHRDGNLLATLHKKPNDPP